MPSAVRSDLRSRRRSFVDDHMPTAHVIGEDPALHVGFTQGANGYAFRVMHYGSVATFVASYGGTRPGCIVICLPLPDMTGVEALRELGQHDIALPIIILSEVADTPTVVQCMKFGASDFLEKPIDPVALHQRIEDMIAEDAEHAHDDAEMSAISRRFDTLSQREGEILELILRGAGSKEIAKQLNISSKTVDVHRTNLMRKVGVSSVTQLIYLGLSVRRHLSMRRRRP
jgi:two-component system, LuxR family, response regulator FixJ